MSSVFSRGPARESGCVNSGDRIKCLNISFDEITLEDAHNILNCGAPYKMRLLLEKKVAPPSAIKRLVCKDQQVAQNGQNRRRRAQETGQNTNSAKVYLKRLANKLNLADYSCDSIGAEQVAPFQVAPPLGSAAARQASLANNNNFGKIFCAKQNGDEADDEVRFVGDGHVNEAFGATSDDEDAESLSKLGQHTSSSSAVAANRLRGPLQLAANRHNLHEVARDGDEQEAAATSQQNWRETRDAAVGEGNQPLRTFDQNQSQPEMGAAKAEAARAQVEDGRCLDTLRPTKSAKAKSTPQSSTLATSQHSVSTPTVHLVGRSSIGRAAKTKSQSIKENLREGVTVEREEADESQVSLCAELPEDAKRAEKEEDLRDLRYA